MSEFADDGKTKFFLDGDEVTCQEFNDFYYAHDTGWCEDENEDGELILTIFRDDAR